MAKKAPRRTALRILETSLGLFNRFGEPNVSTTLVAHELGISPGNLYYHYPAKDELINALYAHYKAALLEILVSAPEVQQLEDAWFFLWHLNERVWAHRFIYRDLNDLLSRNRRIEIEMKDILRHKDTAFQVVLTRLCDSNLLDIDDTERQHCAHQWVMHCTWWLSWAYVMEPRSALEEQNGPTAIGHATRSMLALCLPYARAATRPALQALLARHTTTGSASGPTAVAAPPCHELK